MHHARLFIAALAVAIATIAVQGGTSHAAFHCMRIHAVVGGISGDANIQYVELRMNIGGQTLLTGHQMKFYDAAGTLKATFTFPSGVVNGFTGDSILVGTSEFNAAVTGGISDFTFSGANTVASNGGDAQHPVQLPGGKVTFAEGSDNCDGGLDVIQGEVDSLAYGGATADWGTAAAALPTDTQVLRLSNLNLTPSDNSSEYSLNTASTATFSVGTAQLASDFSTPRNNGRTVLQLLPASIGGIAGLPDTAVGVRAAGEADSNGFTLTFAAGAAVAAAAAGGLALVAARRRAR